VFVESIHENDTRESDNVEGLRAFNKHLKRDNCSKSF
jgi:hypothetical protein